MGVAYASDMKIQILDPVLGNKNSRRERGNSINDDELCQIVPDDVDQDGFQILQSAP